MSLLDCPECAHKVSDRAFACPSCGYPLQAPTEGKPRVWPGVIGNVAGTWISANALATIIVGGAMVIGFFALMIALVLTM